MRNIHEPDAQGFIPGVFNYCDRRCERCMFVRQCRVGAVDQDDLSEDNEKVADENVETYEDRLRRVLERPDDNDDAGGPGSDDDGPFDAEMFGGDEEVDEEEMAEYERKNNARDELLKAHPLTALCMVYTDMVEEWMDPRMDAMNARGVAMHRQQQLQMDPALRTGDVLVLEETVDEVMWFQYMLYVKSQRALLGKIEDEEEGESYGNDQLQSDWNGTAKLTLHICDRCIAAWGTIAELMPEEAATVAPIIAHLQRCAAALRKLFPDAHKFIRAGFDAHMGSPEGE